jgi:hypothetical protein
MTGRQIQRILQRHRSLCTGQRLIHRKALLLPAGYQSGADCRIQIRLYPLRGICLLNGLMNMRSFLRPDAFGQPYEGLDQRNPAQVVEFREPVQYLQDNGYDLGYGPHWNANVLTEMTDGQLPMVAIRRTEATDAQTNGITYVDWLTLRSNRELPTEKTFLMLLHENVFWIQGTVFEGLVSEVYRDDQYVIFDIADHEAFRLALQQREGM